MNTTRTLSPAVTAVFALLTFSPPVPAADRQIGVDPVIVQTWGFSAGEKTVRVVPGRGLAAGFWQRGSGAPAGAGFNYTGTIEFQLPETVPARIRSATYQFSGNPVQCAGSEPVVFEVFAYVADGRADVADATAGTRVAQLSADCRDSPAFAKPIDVTALVRQLAVPSGVRNVGFNIRRMNNRRGPSQFGFSAGKLVIVVADQDVALPSPTDAPAQAGQTDVLGGLLGAAGTFVRGGGKKPARDQARQEANAALQGTDNTAAPGAAAEPVAAASQTAGQPAAAALAPAAPAAVSVDIVGIRLGMSLAEVKRALQSHSQAMGVDEQYGIINHVAATKYLSWVIARNPQGAPAGSSDAIGVHFPPTPNAHRAVFIERFTGFQPNELPLYDTIRKALVRKFGQPSFAADGMMLWTYNAAGTQIVDASTQARCAKFPPIDPPARGQNIMFNGHRTQGCGVTVYARFDRGRGPADRELTRYLSISLIDDSQFEAMRQAAARFANQATRDAASKVAAPKI